MSFNQRSPVSLFAAGLQHSEVDAPQPEADQFIYYQYPQFYCRPTKALFKSRCRENWRQLNHEDTILPQICTMIVTMYLDGTPIDSRSIPEKNLQIVGYFEGLQKDMIEQNEEIMHLPKKDISFSIDKLPPKPTSN